MKRIFKAVCVCQKHGDSKRYNQNVTVTADDEKKAREAVFRKVKTKVRELHWSLR